jgi:energy-converting hydrogenase A subunit M
MLTKIFTDEEHQILESHLISAKVDENELAKVINEIKTQKSMFDDVFIYLQVKKTHFLKKGCFQQSTVISLLICG